MSDMSGIVTVFASGAFLGGCIALAFRRKYETPEPSRAESVGIESAEALKETIGELIENLKAVADDAVAKIESKKRELTRLLSQAEFILRDKPVQDADVDAALRLAGDGADDREITQRAGLSRAEIGFLRNLHGSRYETVNKSPEETL